MHLTADMPKVLKFCRDDLLEAMNWALFDMYQAGTAPARVFHRDIYGQAMSIFTDPCVLFGSDAFVRPQNFERLENFSG